MNVLELQAELDEPGIERLVHAFYGVVQSDPTLGPVFRARIAEDAWPNHLEKMCRFWSTILRGTGRYRGNPMAAHLPLATVTTTHFERWLELFVATARTELGDRIAAAIESRAVRMGEHLQRAMGLT
ncbi:MAG: group III truncated hemoglobin [bacterium]|nr:group III truncated hemoglobin [bacterium]